MARVRVLLVALLAGALLTGWSSASAATGPVVASATIVVAVMLFSTRRRWKG